MRRHLGLYLSCQYCTRVQLPHAVESLDRQLLRVYQYAGELAHPVDELAGA